MRPSVKAKCGGESQNSARYRVRPCAAGIFISRRNRKVSPELRLPAPRFVAMDTVPILESAIRQARNLLRENLPPGHGLSDAETVLRLREMIAAGSVRWALQRSDSYFAFVLRGVQLLLVDQARTEREIVRELWSVLDDTDLDRALGMAQTSRKAADRRARPTSR
jgi:hypothetical protein